MRKSALKITDKVIDYNKKIEKIREEEISKSDKKTIDDFKDNFGGKGKDE